MNKEELKGWTKKLESDKVLTIKEVNVVYTKMSKFCESSELDSDKSNKV